MKILKKAIKLLIIIIPISLIVVLNNKDIKADETEYQKGDLRCPQHISNGEKVHCNAISENGKVVEVDITYNETLSDGGHFELTKIVKKTDTLGHYTVQFKLNGSNVSQQKAINGRVNVVIVFDKSKTMSNKSAAVSAIKSFSKSLTQDNDNFYVGLVQFASSAKKSRNLMNSPITSASGDFGLSSHLEKGLSKAYDMIKSVEGKKYIVVFGDGRYYLDYPSSTCNGEGNGGNKNNCTTRWRKSKHGNNSVEHYLDLFDALDVTRFGVHYNGATKNYGGNVNSKNNYVVDCRGKSYRACDLIYMKKVAPIFADAADKNNYTTEFNQILQAIKDDLYYNSSTVTGGISDKIGDEFYLTDESGRYKRFDIPTIDEKGYVSPVFEIEIDPYADPKAGMADGLEEFWHKTNENFTLNYTAEDGELKTFTIKDNPEVYWIPNSTTLESCSDSKTADTIRGGDDSDEYSFYSRICYEGYNDEKGNYKNGYRVAVKINNQNDGVTKFDLLSGLGFPSAIDISTNMICRYKFDNEKFNKEYQRIVRALNQAEPESKEAAGLTVQLQKYDDILENYKMLSQNNDLENYKNRFIDQPAVLKVTYKNINDSEEINFVNTDNVKTSINCTTKATSNVNGSSIATDKTCYVSLSKSMELPKTCLSMQTGEQEPCSAEKAQLDGNHKFYIKMKANGGEINVDVLKAGYRGNLDFHLKKTNENDGCSFTANNNGMGDIMFRQIELADPFLKNYDINRGVGRNYLNKTFDFQKIIHEDTWANSQAMEYDYFISKVNIEKIRKDTAEDTKNSYLGKNCYFTDSNEYQCSFTRNKIENGVNEGQWFTNAKFPESN